MREEAVYLVPLKRRGGREQELRLRTNEEKRRKRGRGGEERREESREGKGRGGEAKRRTRKNKVHANILFQVLPPVAYFFQCTLLNSLHSQCSHNYECISV